MSTETLSRGIILAIVIAYVISPVDMLPGPIDDIIVMILGHISRKMLERKNDVPSLGYQDYN